MDLIAAMPRATVIPSMNKKERDLFKKCVSDLYALLASKPRQHGTFFEGATKICKEMVTVNQFFALHEELLGQHLVNIRAGSDPPDVIVETSLKEQWAFEVTEIANQAAINARIKQRPRYAVLIIEWEKEVLQRIKERISRKDALYAGRAGEFNRDILLLHTDEPQPSSEALEVMIQSEEWTKPSHFDAVFLLTGPSSGDCLCRVITVT